MPLYRDATDILLGPKNIQNHGKDKIDEIDANTTLTPLIAAIRTGQAKSVRVLVDAGANVDKTSPDGRTPLFWATWEKNAGNRVDIVRILLEANPKPEVDLTSVAVGNNTPLMNAILKLQPHLKSFVTEANLHQNLPSLHP